MIRVKDIHLIGVTCIWVSSKIEEVIPFKIGTVVEKMTHDKISAKKIRKMEEKLLKVLHFKIYSLPNYLSHCELLMIFLELHKKSFFE